MAFGLMTTSFMMILVIATWYGSWLVDNAVALPQKIMQTLLCALSCGSAAESAAQFWPEWSRGRAAAYEVFRVIDSEENTCDYGEVCATGKGDIVFENVEFVY